MGLESEQKKTLEKMYAAAQKYLHIIEVPERSSVVSCVLLAAKPTSWPFVISCILSGAHSLTT